MSAKKEEIEWSADCNKQVKLLNAFAKRKMSECAGIFMRKSVASWLSDEFPDPVLQTLVEFCDFSVCYRGPDINLKKILDEHIPMKVWSSMDSCFSGERGQPIMNVQDTFEKFIWNAR